MKKIYTLLLLSLTGAGLLTAQDGRLDSAFGTNGRAFGGIIASGAGGRPALVIQPDQKIVQIAGPLISTNLDFEVLRFNTDGTADNTFNGNGRLLLNFGAKEVAQCVTLQPDGKILVGGHKDGLIMIIRLNTDGSLDGTFNGTGWKQYDILSIGGEQYASAMAVQPDGKIVVAVSVFGGYGNRQFVVMRINSSGALDNSFNGTGYHILEMGGEDYAQHIAVGTNGSIIVGGVTLSNATVNYDGAFARFLADGTLDVSFNSTGKLVLSISEGEDEVNDMILLPDGKILFGGYGYRSQTDYDFLVGRLMTDGTLDNTFGTAGIAYHDLGGRDLAWGLDVLPDGKIVQSGNALVTWEPGFCAVTRYLANGSRDLTFGVNGVASFDFGSGHAFYGSAPLQSVKVQADGKIVAGGIARIVGGAYGYYTNENVLIRLTGTPPIPITDHINTFTGELNGRTVLLRWTAYNNDSIASFNVQRSVDETNFTTIGTVQAIARRFVYTYVDQINALMEYDELYYRIEVVDTAGNKKYTEPITIVLAPPGLAAERMSLTAIPGTNDIQVRFTADQSERGVLSVFSVDGKLLSRRDIEIAPGFNQWNHYLPLQSGGLYVVQIRAGSRTYVKKVMK